MADMFSALAKGKMEVGKEAQAEKAAQQSQKPLLNINEGLTTATSLKTDVIRNVSIDNFKTEEKKGDIEIKKEETREQNDKTREQNDKTREQNEMFSDSRKRLDELRLSGKGPDVIKYNELLDRSIELYKTPLENWKSEHFIEHFRISSEMRTLKTDGFSKEDLKKYNEAMKIMEKLDTEVTNLYLGINSGAVENRVTAGVMNYLINTLELKYKESEDRHKKIADEIFLMMERMNAYLKNPNNQELKNENGEIRLHEDNEVSNNLIALSTMYFAKAQKDYYNEGENYVKYAEAKEFYNTVMDTMKVTYMNDQGKIETTTGKDYLEEQKSDITYNGEPLSYLERRDFNYAVATKTDTEIPITGTGEIGMA